MRIELIKELSKIEDKELLVSILILTLDKLKLSTISDTAKKEGKTYRGILLSNQYRKIEIGGKIFIPQGLKESEFPF